VKQVTQDYTKASLAVKDCALLDYAAKLTREPWTMSAADIQKLRGAGWSDSAILDLNLTASYYNFVNRLADGLGVELEAHKRKKEA